MHGTQTKAAWRPSLDETERLLALAGGWRGESSRGKTQSEIARAIGIDVETFSSWLLKTRACIQSRPHTITSARFVMDLQKLEKRPPEIKDADARRIRERALKRAALLAAVLPTWPNAPLPPPNPILEIARDRRGGWQVGGKRRGQCGAYARRRDQEVDYIDDEPANEISNNVSVIETAGNTVMTTVAVGSAADGVAVTPDGTHVYVATAANVSVIATATNTVVATVTGGNTPVAVAVTPDGKHAYVVNVISRTVSVIATATNTVVATVGVGFEPFKIAVTPDGTHVYVTNENPFGSGTVSVIATATNTVVATVPVGLSPFGVAVTPDGKHAYVTNVSSPPSVSVIATATNTVVATVPGVANPVAVAVTPDGKHAYVANFAHGTVSVIDTATNTVEPATITVGAEPVAVGIVPPPPGIPFLAFNAKLAIDLEPNSNKDRFELKSHFTLSSTAPGIHPVTKPVTVQVGTFTVTIPPGSFKKHEGEDGEEEHEDKDGFFTFHGVIDGVSLEALIKRTGTLRYAFHAAARDANLAGTKNTVYVTLTIGGDSGATSVKADIDH